jgi:hypothetical protein
VILAVKGKFFAPRVNFLTIKGNATTNAADFTYSMRGKVISITYLGTGSINKAFGRILRRIEHGHQGSVKSFKILYQDADGLGGEVT